MEAPVTSLPGVVGQSHGWTVAGKKSNGHGFQLSSSQLHWRGWVGGREKPTSTHVKIQAGIWESCAASCGTTGSFGEPLAPAASRAMLTTVEGCFDVFRGASSLPTGDPDVSFPLPAYRGAPPCVCVRVCARVSVYESLGGSHGACSRVSSLRLGAERV